MKTIPQVTAQQAQAAVNQFISDYISDRFTADQAQLDLTGEGQDLLFANDIPIEYWD